MGKFNSTIGLSTKQIGSIKYRIRTEILNKLPELPDSVETMLFLQGREAWTFSWNFLNKNTPVYENEIISIEVLAKLKKEFHCYQTTFCYKYICNVETAKDISHMKLLIAEIIA